MDGQPHYGGRVMAGAALPESDLRRALALIVAYHDAGRPLTAVQLGDSMGLAAESGRARSRVLVERGDVAVVVDGKGASRLYPTPAARILDLPNVTVAAVPGKRQRPCMRCRQTFTSDGAHHRHCTRCRQSLAEQAAGGCFAF